MWKQDRDRRRPPDQLERPLANGGPPIRRKAVMA